MLTQQVLEVNETKEKLELEQKIKKAYERLYEVQTHEAFTDHFILVKEFERKYGYHDRGNF